MQIYIFMDTTRIEFIFSNHYEIVQINSMQKHLTGS
jgi:hypothetical protein